MNHMTIKEAKRDFDELLKTVKGGEPVSLTEDGIVLATITPQPERPAQDTVAFREQLAHFRKTAKSGVTIDEILAWKHEDHFR